MCRFSSLLAAGGLLALTALPALAHAFPVETDPPVGWTVAVAPKQVVIDYTMGLQPGLAFITVQSPSGRVVSVGPSQVSGPDSTILTQRLGPLAPGRYLVVWHVLAVDGHPTQGKFSFTVG